ncbi:MAG: GGDEF domain-containing protein [Geobacter sp.]|nr:GGDEF domain-containing protein [Geobacter sp.]
MSWLIFSGGLFVGLMLHPFARMLKSDGINYLLDLIGQIVTAPFSALVDYFQKRSDLSKAGRGVELPDANKVDPREQQISDSAQTIRSILLSLATAIHRTDRAASDSSHALREVRAGIEQADLPDELTTAHALLIAEIDRVIASNSELKGELASSQAILATQREQIEALKTAVRIDGLTQLANRAYFDEKLLEMIRLHQRYKEPFALMMIDVDYFKTINDSHGHQAGDRILKGVAYKIKATLRESDFLARFGGDEFALVLIKAGLQPATTLAEKICTNIRESRFILDGTEFKVTLSIGVAEVHADDTPETLLERADKALYLVKERGRNGVEAKKYEAISPAADA